MDEIRNKQAKVYDHYGLDHQLGKLEEECMELALAIKKFRCNPWTQESSTNVVEEMADVLNLIEQISDNNGTEKNLRTWKERKVNRELERIKNRSI